MPPSVPLDALDPDAVTPDAVGRDALRDGLRAESNRTRVHAAKLTATLAAETPDHVEPIVPTIADCLGDDRIVVDRELASALASIADESTDAVEPAVGPLVDLLGHEVPVVRSVAAMPVRSLALDRPSWFLPHAESLLAVVERPVEDPTAGFEVEPLEEPGRHELHQTITQDEEQRQLVARAVAATVIVEIANKKATALADHADRVVGLLEDDSPLTVGAAADVVGSLVAAGVDIHGATEPLCDALGTWEQDNSLRARVVRALGHIGDPNAAEYIERVADDEEAPPELREIATETVGWLAEQEN